MKPVATLILNRNLPEVTDALVDRIRTYNDDLTDVFVIESGSDQDKLSKNCTWWANWPEALQNGLRVPRGFNYGLSQLFKEGRYEQYSYFFQLTNDTVLEERPIIADLLEVMSQHPRVGILSPCSNGWGESKLLNESDTKYFWFVHNVAYLLRREFLDTVRELQDPDHLNFLYDGSNFRGFFLEQELIAKGYANDWATAITKRVLVEENEEYLKRKSESIKTENYEDNMKLFLQEGALWMRKKYGFNSRWMMQKYAKFLYESFFEFHPECNKFKI